MPFPFLDRFKDGQFVPLSHKKAIPVGSKRPETLQEQVARLVRHSEFAKEVAARGLETFEEADDFDVPDDPYPMPKSYWEDQDMATIDAMHQGVVAEPPLESLNTSRRVLDKVKDAISRKSTPVGGGTTPDKGAAPVDPIKSEGGAPE